MSAVVEVLGPVRGTVLGLVAGTGLFCVWWACWASPAPAVARTGLIARWRRRTGDDLTAAGVHGLSPGVLAAASLSAGLVVGTGALAVSSSPPIALCFAVIVGSVPVRAVRARADRRREELRGTWPEAVDDLASAVRAGLSLPEALAALRHRGPVPLRAAFAVFADDYRASGRFMACLDDLKVRLADPVGDRVVEALRLTREVGGNDLGRLLRTLSTFLRDDARTRAELITRQGWTVNGARLAVAAPWAVLALLATRSEAVAAYNSGAGVLVLAIGAGASLGAYRLMMVLGRLPSEERVLR